MAGAIERLRETAAPISTVNVFRKQGDFWLIGYQGSDAVRGAKAMGWIGFNCSLPNKIAVIPSLDGLGESAQIIGAVNTVVRRDDRYIGENTDGRGFVVALRHLVDPAGKTVVLFGAGGAARAVAVEMALAGATRILVVNRNRTRGELA
jgi:shikimate dehydrogenase